MGSVPGGSLPWMPANLGLAHSCNDGQTFLLGKERSPRRNILVVECVPSRLGELVHVLFSRRHESRRETGHWCRSAPLPHAEPKVFYDDREHASLPGRRSAGTKLTQFAHSARGLSIPNFSQSAATSRMSFSFRTYPLWKRIIHSGAIHRTVFPSISPAPSSEPAGYMTPSSAGP